MTRSFTMMGASLVAAALLGCGGGEPTGSDAETPPVSAATGDPHGMPVATDAAKQAGTPAERCLRLVEDGQFREAIHVCITARDADPNDGAVEQALAEARREATKLGAALPSADQAAQAARSAAADAVEDLDQAAGAAAGEAEQAADQLEEATDRLSDRY